MEGGAFCSTNCGSRLCYEVQQQPANIIIFNYFNNKLIKLVSGRAATRKMERWLWGRTMCGQWAGRNSGGFWLNESKAVRECFALLLASRLVMDFLNRFFFKNIVQYRYNYSNVRCCLESLCYAMWIVFLVHYGSMHDCDACWGLNQKEQRSNYSN